MHGHFSLDPEAEDQLQTLTEHGPGGGPDSEGAGTVIRAGFIPLLDAAPLVAAAEKGFAAREGVRLQLVREISWANIRDRIAVGHFDVAHMLAPMPVASTLGVGRLTVPMIAPFSLGHGSNCVTVSKELWRSMEAHGATADGNPVTNGEALHRIVQLRARGGQVPLTFAMVYPFSCQNYLMRYWLAASGIHPDRDVRLVVVPPPLMVDALRGRHVDGFCVGDPWNSLAVEADVGAIVTTKAAIWPKGPEKVLGMRADWAQRHPQRLRALLRALHRSAQWCDDPANHDELAGIMARPDYVGADARVMKRSLDGAVTSTAPARMKAAGFFDFARDSAAYPWGGHALWLFSQMVRWGQVTFTPEAAEAVRSTFRPDIYCGAATGLPGAPGPLAPAHDGALPAGDGLFDGVPFDPARLSDYIGGFPMRTAPDGRHITD
jgi:NitT/TauT family transport system ATP-binding protein